MFIKLKVLSPLIISGASIYLVDYTIIYNINDIDINKQNNGHARVGPNKLTAMIQVTSLQTKYLFIGLNCVPSH